MNSHFQLMFLQVKLITQKKLIQKVKHPHKQKYNGSNDYYICSKYVFQKVKHLHEQKCDGSQDYYIGSKSVLQKYFKKLRIFIKKCSMAHKIIILAGSLFFKSISKKLGKVLKNLKFSVKQ